MHWPSRQVNCSGPQVRPSEGKSLKWIGVGKASKQTKTSVTQELCVRELVCESEHTAGSVFVRAVRTVLLCITDKLRWDAFPACHTFEFLWAAWRRCCQTQRGHPISGGLNNAVLLVYFRNIVCNIMWSKIMRQGGLEHSRQLSSSESSVHSATPSHFHSMLMHCPLAHWNWLLSQLPAEGSQCPFGWVSMRFEWHTVVHLLPACDVHRTISYRLYVIGLERCLVLVPHWIPMQLKLPHIVKK